MNVYNNLLTAFRSSYMLMMPLAIIAQSCLGSIAALYILMNKGPFMIWQLALCIAVTMMFNATVLAQLKVTIVFRFLLLSLFVNTGLLLLV